MAQTDWWVNGDLVEELPLIDGLTAASAELNLADGSIAGTAVASKFLALGSNKNVDVLVIADGGFKLGSGAGTAVTATAAELNLIDGSIAGTAVASKALSLGADKNVDVLAIADGGLKLGAGAGTAVTSTAAELNLLDGVTATMAEINIACDQSLGVQAISGAAAITADGTIDRVTLTGGAYAFTLAAPGAAAVGKFLCINIQFFLS